MCREADDGKPRLRPVAPQFFISFVQSWRYEAREPALRNDILTDGHAPADYRALTVRNIDPWYRAFGVKPGAKLYLRPPNRVRVW